MTLDKTIIERLAKTFAGEEDFEAMRLKAEREFRRGIVELGWFDEEGNPLVGCSSDKQTPKART